jgi:hypothetical protein
MEISHESTYNGFMRTDRNEGKAIEYKESNKVYTWMNI